MDPKRELLNLAKRIQAISVKGQHFSDNDDDMDKYENPDSISRRMISRSTYYDPEKINKLLPENYGYRTPKVDIKSR